MSKVDDDRFEDMAAVAAMQSLIRERRYDHGEDDESCLAAAAWDVAIAMGYERRWQRAHALCEDLDCGRGKRCDGCKRRMASDE